MAYDNAVEDDYNLRFLIEDEREGRDEADSVSKHVISFETSAVLPKYVCSQDSTAHGVRKAGKRLRTVSESTFKKFNRNVPYLQDDVAALLTFKNILEEDQVKRLPSFLRDFCDGVVFHVLYNYMNIAIVIMEAKSYTFIGNKIVDGNGFRIQNMLITGLEALLPESMPSLYIEMTTPKSIGEAVQSELSRVLVTFCGSFKYLRLHDGEQPDQKPSNPSVSLTLLFSKRAQGNALKFNNALLGQAPWIAYQPPEVVRVPFEQLFLLKTYPALLLGLISGNDIPGIRISLTFSTKKQEVLEFYRVLTGKDPVCRSERTGTAYMIYPIAKNLELQLIYNPTVHTNSSSNIVTCLRIADHKKISAALSQLLTFIDDGQWETSDPVGNRIRLFTPFE